MNGMTDKKQKKNADAKKAPDYLILVNRDHPFDKAFLDTIELISFSNIADEETLIEKKTNEAVLKLIDRMKEEGLTFGRGGVFRTVEYQQSIMDRFIQNKGLAYARRYVAEPGASEHHTGLAIDLIPFIDGAWRRKHEELFAATEQFAALHRILPEYGFILRYPEGKEDITKVSYEPWHIRYVGEEIAREITDKGLTLEEYLEKN